MPQIFASFVALAVEQIVGLLHGIDLLPLMKK
jgi:hypothetical protein